MRGPYKETIGSTLDSIGVEELVPPQALCRLIAAPMKLLLHFPRQAKADKKKPLVCGSRAPEGSKYPSMKYQTRHDS